MRALRSVGAPVSDDEAVKAAAEAIHSLCGGSLAECGAGEFHDEEAAAVVPAVWPIIEADVRAKIAAEIEAFADMDGTWIGPTDPDAILRRAARIARGEM